MGGAEVQLRGWFLPMGPMKGKFEISEKWWKVVIKDMIFET